MLPPNLWPPGGAGWESSRGGDGAAGGAAQALEPGTLLIRATWRLWEDSYNMPISQMRKLNLRDWKAGGKLRSKRQVEDVSTYSYYDQAWRPRGTNGGSDREQMGAGLSARLRW